MNLRNVFDSNISQVFLKHGIEYIQELPFIPIEELIKKTGLEKQNVEYCVKKSLDFLCPKHTTAYSLQPERYLSTGCKELDDLLEGGYPSGTLFEICGESGGISNLLNSNEF